MRPKVVLLARLGPTEGFKFLPVDIVKGRPRLVEGATSYYLRFSQDGRRRVVPIRNAVRRLADGTCAADMALILSAYRSAELNHARIRQGLHPLVEDFVSHSDRLTIAEAAQKFSEELAALDKSKATRLAYMHAVRGFQESCTKTFVDELGREDMLDYITWLRANLGRRSVGEQSNTIRNRLRYVSIFLNKYGKTNLLPASEWPKRMKKIPDKYSPETIRRLLAAADKKERLVLEFFLYSGCRDREVAHAEWGDINTRANTFRIQSKPRWGWRPKDSEEREVPLPANYVKRLMASRSPQSKCGLIFPSSACRPDMCLIRLLQRAAKRAGITERVTLHKFRRTTGSLYAKRFGVHTAQKLLGHSNIQTTSLYLSPDDLTDIARRPAVEDLFAEAAGGRRSR